MQMDDHQTPYPFYHKENAQCYGRSQKICVSVAAMPLFDSCLFSRSMKLRGLPPSAVTVSLHYLPKTGLPGPDGPKMPNCTSKYARQLQKMPNKLKQADGCQF